MLDSLYENIGGKLKSWAKWIFIVEAIGAVIGGFALMAEDFMVGLLLLVMGPLVAWVSSWLLYGFGELVEKTAANESNTAQILAHLTEEKQAKPQKAAEPVRRAAAETPAQRPASQKVSNTDNAPVAAPIVAGDKVCPKCGTVQKADRRVCWSCGQRFED